MGPEVSSARQDASIARSCIRFCTKVRRVRKSSTYSSLVKLLKAAGIHVIVSGQNIAQGPAQKSILLDGDEPDLVLSNVASSTVQDSEEHFFQVYNALPYISAASHEAVQKEARAHLVRRPMAHAAPERIHHKKPAHGPYSFPNIPRQACPCHLPTLPRLDLQQETCLESVAKRPADAAGDDARHDRDETT